MAGRQLLAAGAVAARQAQEIEGLEQRLATLNRLSVSSNEPDERTVSELLDAGFGSTAAEWVQRSGVKTDDWDWHLVDRLAATWMHLGRPELARSLWQTSDQAPSAAARLARLADAWWVEGDLAKAEQGYRAAIDAERAHADSHWALAMLYADRGAAADTRRACAEALRCNLPDPQRDEVRSILTMLTRHGDGEDAQHR